MVAVVGASGVGKSTFLQILGTLDYRPRVDQVRRRRADDDEPEPALRVPATTGSGSCSSFTNLLPEFSALENVMMPALIQR